MCWRAIKNGRVERKHRHILNVARACLFQVQLPSTLWGESILFASHLINYTPSQFLQGKTPYELVFRNKPYYALLRFFGCLCYAHRKSRDKDINLEIKVDDVYSWDIHMGRRHGCYMILTLVSSSLAVMWRFLKQNSHVLIHKTMLLHHTIIMIIL